MGWVVRHVSALPSRYPGRALEATISAALYEFDVDIVKPDGTFAAYIGYPYRSGPPAISAPVTAGSVRNQVGRNADRF